MNSLRFAHMRLISQPSVDELSQRASRLWPDDQRNAREWLRAVAVVRSTDRGWLLDCSVRRIPQPNDKL